MSLQLVVVQTIIPPQVQDVAFLWVEVHEVLLSPVLQPAEFLPNSCTPIWCIECSSPFCTLHKLAEGEFHPIVQVTDEDVKQSQPLGFSLCDSPPAGLHAPRHNLGSLAVQAVFSPPPYPFT